jgi:hypothetical protein
VVNAINDVVFSTVLGDASEFGSRGIICKTMDHVVDAYLLSLSDFYIMWMDHINFPCHQISLKIGVPKMLLRTIDQTIGLYNGTFLMVTRL